MNSSIEYTYVALDIGARSHAFACEYQGRRSTGTVANDPTALRAFLAAQHRGRGTLRVLMEATGLYYLDVALLASELGAEVSVINPRVAHHFAQVWQQRSKTDRLDALVLLECLKRLPFTAWTAPPKNLLALRAYGRYLVQLTEERIAARNRLHALDSTRSSPAPLRADLRRFIASLDRRIARLRAQALALIEADPELQPRFHALDSIIGVAGNSAVSLLGELLLLPRSLNARACVCHAGLDPRLFDSGTSVHKAPRISRRGNRYLRRALFYPALAASRHDPYARAFKQRLLAHGKKKMQANVALMRKLLTAAWIIVRDPQPYDPTKLYATLNAA